MSALVAVGEAGRRQRFADGCNGGARGWSRRLPRGFRRDRRGGWSRCVWRGDHGQWLTARNGWRVGRSNRGRRGRQRQRHFPRGFRRDRRGGWSCRAWDGDHGQRLAARNGWRVGRSNRARRSWQRLSAWNDGSGRLRSGRWRRGVALGLWPGGREGGGGRSPRRWRDRQRLGRLASGGSRGGRDRSPYRVCRGAGR